MINEIGFNKVVFFIFLIEIFCYFFIQFFYLKFLFLEIKCSTAKRVLDVTILDERTEDKLPKELVLVRKKFE